MDFSLPFLTKHLIAYIGNKRSLLSFVGPLFEQLREGRSPGVFLDPFAGSGAVSRLALVMGFKVLANDWEPYARLVNEAHLTIRKGALAGLFKKRGGVEAAFSHYNALKHPLKPEQSYFSRFYAPAETETADYRTERLFYTRENALFLDRVRQAIEEDYPSPGPGGSSSAERVLLLSSLIYESSVHSNTNGVFKAFHKGFGGHGKDALKRILSPMELEIPVLWDPSQPAEVFSQDAAGFVRGRTAEIAYLDPPYNQHQYGSNYHLLNTVALGDRPLAPMDLSPNGRLKDKAGIRKDWPQRHSPFCVKSQAPTAFRELLAALDARHIVLSYNTEGIIPFPELWDLLQSQGPTRLLAQDYVTYRGGRQSPSRKLHNMELLLVLSRSGPRVGSGHSRVRRFLLEKHLHRLLLQSFHPERLKSQFVVKKGSVFLGLGNQSDDEAVWLRTLDGYRLVSDPPDWAAWTIEELESLQKKLEESACRSRAEEALVLLTLLAAAVEQGAERSIRSYERRLLLVLRKFAFKKYRDEFWAVFTQIDEFCARTPAAQKLRNGLDSLKELARMRIEG